MRISDIHGQQSKISPAAKDLQSVPILIVSNTWKSIADIQSYISHYLGQIHRLEDDLSYKLIGRVRPVALFIEQCLLCFKCIDFEVGDYFREYYNTLTKSSTLQWSLSYLFHESRFAKHEFIQVMEILKKAVYFQLCFGFPYVLNVDSHAQLFEYAFGILYEEPMPSGVVEMKIVINEPFILQTAYNLFSRNGYDFLKLTAEARIGESLISSSRGYLWEVSSLQGYLCLQEYFPHRFTDLAPKLYRILTGIDLESKIHNHKLEPMISKGGIGDQGGILLSSYLENPGLYGTFFIPHFNAGPDLCFFIEVENTLIPVFVQLKLSSHVSRVKALATTDPLEFYTSKNKQRSENYAKEYRQCINILKRKYGGRNFGILIVYPQSWKSSKTTTTTSNGWNRFEKVFDGANRGDIFDVNHLKYLGNIGIE